MFISVIVISFMYCVSIANYIKYHIISVCKFILYEIQCVSNCILYIYISFAYHTSIIYTVHYYIRLNELLLMYIGGNTFCTGPGRPHVTEQYWRRPVLEFPNLLKIFFCYLYDIYIPA